MKSFKLLFTLALCWLLSGCGSVAVTGRKQLLLVSDQEVLAARLTQYKEYMQTAPRSTQKSQSASVSRVGQRIAEATERYLRANGLENEIQNFAWEFSLIKDQQINAFCMPGGKIVVYEGLMNVVSSDDELAVVIGHEVAHAVAKHSNERMSQQILANYGARLLSESLSQKSAAMQKMAQSVYGLGAQYGVMLPFSRKHEYEADYMGLIFMRLAGYQPDAAVGFWQKMSSGATTSRSDFLSTHPSDAKRIAEIKRVLPEVKAKYQ